MAQDWLADVRKYDADADEVVVDKIVKHCGIALRTRDASLVSFSDSKETDRVRESFCKKKLALTDDDATLDAAIASVGETMKADRTKNRVTVYYLLAKHFGKLGLFGGVAAPAAAVAAAAIPAATAAPTVTPAPTAPPAETPVMSAMSSPASDSHGGRPAGGGGDGIVGFGCLAAVVSIGAIVIAALIAVWASSTVLEREPEPVAAPAPAPAPPPEPAVPDGAGVTATERNGAPMLTVYFDTGSAEVTPDFEAVSADLLAYLEANPDASLQISGYNDPSGNAELNAALSRDRAMGVQAALVALGIDEARTDLVRPDDTTTTDMTPAEARRVEVTVVE